MPEIGRFTQADTYHGDGLNLYVYARNNPVKYVDPSGHVSKGNDVPSSDGATQSGDFLPNGSRIKWGNEHGTNNVRHNNAIEYELDWAEQQGATNIKKNSYQVDVNGNVVKGDKQRKPDASYTLNGERVNINYVSNYELDNNRELNRELQAFLDMCKADSNAKNVLVFQYKKYSLKQ